MSESKSRDVDQESRRLIREDLLTKKFGQSLVGQDRRFPLYWRYAKECRILEETQEADSKTVPIDIRRPKRHKIITRIAIPGANWDLVDYTKPEGEPFLSISV